MVNVNSVFNTFFSLLGYSFAKYKSFRQNSNKNYIQLPFAFNFQKYNIIFPFFRFIFSFINLFLTKLICFFLFKYKILSFLIYVLFLIKFILLNFINNLIFIENNKIICVFNFLTIKVRRLISIKFNTELKKLKNTTKFISWFYTVFCSRRKWRKEDHALFYISHFVLYNFALSNVLELSSMIFCSFLDLLFFWKFLILSKEIKSFVFNTIETIKTLIYIFSCICVIYGRYPNKIPVFSKSADIMVGAKPGEKPKKFEMPGGRVFFDKDFLDKDI